MLRVFGPKNTVRMCTIDFVSFYLLVLTFEAVLFILVVCMFVVKLKLLD